MPGLHSGRLQAAPGGLRTVFCVAGILLLVTFLAGANGGAEADVGGLGARGARNNNPDQLQEDILAAMKDSGVLDEWKEKLDDMLYNEVQEEDGQRKEGKNAFEAARRPRRLRSRTFTPESTGSGFSSIS